MDFERFLSSEITEFVVVGEDGHDERSYYINRHLIARLSGTLKALVSGGMREAVEGRVVFREVDPQTFVHVAAYAMTGRYPVGQSVFEDGCGVDTVAGKDVRGRRPDYTTSRMSVEDDDAYASGAAGPSRWKGKAPALEGSFMEEVVESDDELLQHAKLYVFADTYDVTALKQSAFSSVEQALHFLAVDGAASTVHSIVRMVRYVYTHTMEDPSERLRCAISTFCAGNIRVLVLFHEFSELQAEGGSFAVDLMNSVLHEQQGGRVGKGMRRAWGLELFPEDQLRFDESTVRAKQRVFRKKMPHDVGWKQAHFVDDENNDNDSSTTTDDVTDSISHHQKRTRPKGQEQYPVIYIMPKRS